MNGDRIGRWLLTSLFAIAPPGLACMFFYVDGKPPFEAITDAPEIGFTALMLSATSWSELREARQKVPTSTVTVGEYVFVILALTSGIFYGVHSKSLYLNPSEEAFRDFLSNITFCLALASLLVGTIYQFLLARIEG